MGQLKKPELIKILVEEYGYEKDDIKLFTNAKLSAIIKQEEKDVEEFQKEETIETLASTKFNDTDEIAVMYGGAGGYKHTSRDGRVWKFASFGQTDKMPYKELLLIKNLANKVFSEGYIVVLNKDVQKILSLDEIYKNIITPENIEQVFSKNLDELETLINNLPEGMKISFISKAREMYLNRTLYDMRVIELIQNKFGFSLEDNAPLTDFV